MHARSFALYALTLQARELVSAYRAEADAARRNELLHAYRLLQDRYCASLREQIHEIDLRDARAPRRNA